MRSPTFCTTTRSGLQEQKLQLGARPAADGRSFNQHLCFFSRRSDHVFIPAETSSSYEMEAMSLLMLDWPRLLSHGSKCRRLTPNIREMPLMLGRSPDNSRLFLPFFLLQRGTKDAVPHVCLQSLRNTTGSRGIMSVFYDVHAVTCGISEIDNFCIVFKFISVELWFNRLGDLFYLIHYKIPGVIQMAKAYSKDLQRKSDQELPNQECLKKKIINIFIIGSDL